MPESNTTDTIDLSRIDALCAGTWADADKPKVAELRARAISGEISTADLSREVVEVIRASRPQGPAGFGGGNGNGNGGTASRNTWTNTRDLLTAAALVLGGRGKLAEDMGEQVVQQAADLRATSAMDLCRAALQLENRDIPRSRDELIRAAFSTTSLPVAFGSSLQKTAMGSFMETPGTWRLMGAPRTVNNFREHKALRPYHADGRFSELGPDGEIKHTAPNEESFSHRAKTYAKMFSVTRTNIVNDDLGVVQDLAADLGRQGRATISDEFWRLVLSNPDTFFATGNGNYFDGASSALGIDSLSTAVKLLREQTDADGAAIDIEPFALIVPPALEAAGKTIINSQLVRDQSEDNQISTSPWAGSLELGVEPRISNAKFTGNSATQWYLTASPVNVPAMLVSFLNGQQGPTIEQADQPANVLGMAWRGFVDFGVDPGDTRAAIKSKGAA